MLYLAVGI